MHRAWSLLTVDEAERQFSGNLGYGDVLGSRYVWDSTVPNHANVQPGDLAVLRNGSFVLGVAWIDEILTGTRSKVRRRCPSCRSTAFKTRKHATPRYKCSPCKDAFDVPTEEQIEVTVYAADYERTWRTTTDMRTTALTPAYLSQSQQHSIRELNIAYLPSLLTDPADVGPLWWTDASSTNLPGGHRPVIGRARIGQEKFRKMLQQRFGNTCAITGPQPAAAIDAAHLYRYCDTAHHDPNGGLLLRRDLHSLFDRFLLAIDPTTWTVRVAPSLTAFPGLARFEGASLAIAVHTRPNPDYLSAHLAWAEDVWHRQGAAL
jgi:hypothetical protein